MPPTATPLPTAMPVVWPTPVLPLHRPGAEVAPFNPDEWPHWTDEDGDCRETRQEVLIRDENGAGHLTYTDNSNCEVISGVWYPPYVVGGPAANPEWLDVAHMVPLENAHRSGGWKWDTAKKRRYANSIGHLFLIPWNLYEERGGKAPDEWRPYGELAWCEYAKDWIRTKKA